MTIRFRPLCSLEVTHDFYTSGASPDFRVLLGADAARLLRRGRLIARERDGRLHLLVELGDDGEPLAPLDGELLRVGLALLNPSFANVTQLDGAFPRRALAWTNAADAAALAPAEPFVFVGDQFAHTPATAERPVTVTLLDEDGAVLGDETLVADGEAASFDVRTVPPGRLTVTEASAGGTATASYYRHPELRALGAVAVVEIVLGPALYAADPAPALAVAFAASASVLRYYVVARNYGEAEFAQLAVSDAGAVAGAPAASAIAFETVEPDDFGAAEVSPALLAGADDRLVLFRSTAAVPRREQGGRRLQLSRNGDVLIANLPQPGPDRSDAALIIHVSRP